MGMLKIASVFRTIDGEVSVGGPWHWTVFVRLGGCNLRCWKSQGFCDAPHTLDIKHPYPELSVEDAVTKILSFGEVPRVTITGGEPLLQEEPVTELCNQLRDLHSRTTTLETSGSIPISASVLRSISSVIMDVKPPSTEMSKKNLPANMRRLRRKDYVKFVIADEYDYRWSLAYLDDHKTAAQPAFGVKWKGDLSDRTLLDWIERDERFDIMHNMQSHKHIWDCSVPRVQTLRELNYSALESMEH